MQLKKYTFYANFKRKSVNYREKKLLIYANHIFHDTYRILQGNIFVMEQTVERNQLIKIKKQIKYKISYPRRMFGSVHGNKMIFEFLRKRFINRINNRI